MVIREAIDDVLAGWRPRWLAKTFNDQKSYGGFKARCEEAWRSEIPVDYLVEAYRQARNPTARNAGAVFMHTLRRREWGRPDPPRREGFLGGGQSSARTRSISL